MTNLLETLLRLPHCSLAGDSWGCHHESIDLVWFIPSRFSCKRNTHRPILTKRIPDVMLSKWHMKIYKSGTYWGFSLRLFFALQVVVLNHSYSILRCLIWSLGILLILFDFYLKPFPWTPQAALLMSPFLFYSSSFWSISLLKHRWEPQGWRLSRFRRNNVFVVFYVFMWGKHPAGLGVLLSLDIRAATALWQSDKRLRANEEHSCFLQMPIDN